MYQKGTACKICVSLLSHASLAVTSIFTTAHAHNLICVKVLVLFKQLWFYLLLLHAHDSSKTEEPVNALSFLGNCDAVISLVWIHMSLFDSGPNWIMSKISFSSAISRMLSTETKGIGKEKSRSPRIFRKQASNEM